MCNQAVGLVSAVLEAAGIASVTIQILREVAEKVRPPRSLLVPFAHGHPLGRAEDPALQRAVIEAALELLEDSDSSPPVLREFLENKG